MKINKDLTSKLTDINDYNKILKRNRHIFFGKLNRFETSDESKLTKQYGDLVNNKCSTNFLRVLNDNDKFKIFTCNTCKVKQKNICEWCYVNCHSHDQNQSKSEDEVSAKFIRCSCAMSDHKIEQKQNACNIFRSNTKSESICNMNEYFSQFNWNFYFLTKDTNAFENCDYMHLNRKTENLADDNLCLYCVKFCHNIMYFESFCYTKSKSDFSEENFPKCKCKNINCHTNNFDSITSRIKEIIIRFQNISDKQMVFYLPMYQISVDFVQSYHFDTTEKSLRDFHSKILTTEDFTKLQYDQLSLSYSESLDLLKFIEDIFDNFYLNFYIKRYEDLCSFNFLEKLFKFFPVKNCSLLKVKLICSSIYRKHVLNEKPSFITLRELKSEENFSPLHGTVFKQNITYLEGCIGVSQEKLLSLIKSMLRQAIEYNGKFEDEKLYFEFIKETIKWIQYIILFEFDKEEYLLSLLKDFADLFELVKDKTKYEQTLRRDLEELTLSLIYLVNENVFKDYLRKIISQTQIKSIVNIDRKKFVFEKGSKIQKYILNSFFGSDQKKVDHLSFNYENINVDNTIHLALFSNRDYFSESLKAILESDSEYINEFFLNKIITNTYEEYNYNGKEILGEYYFLKLSKNIENLNELKNSVILNPNSTNNFINNLNIQLENTIKDLLEILDFKEDISKEERINQNHKQIFICKMGFINILQFFPTIIYSLQIHEDYKLTTEEVFSKSIEIFKFLTKNNSFTSCLFFNKTIAISLVNFATTKTKIIEFYYYLMTNLKKENYKTSWSFIDTICFNIDFLIYNIRFGKIDELRSDLPIYCKFLNEYFDILDDKLYENTCSIISCYIDLILEDDDNTKMLNNRNMLDDNDAKYILKEILQLIIKLSNYYFYYIIDRHKSLINLVEKIIERFDKLNCEEFYIYTKFIFRCKIEAPFAINGNYESYNRQTYEDMLTKFDANLLGRFNEINPENLNEEKI